jgi:hypothetical protein
VTSTYTFSLEDGSPLPNFIKTATAVGAGGTLSIDLISRIGVLQFSYNIRITGTAP